jgi:hypothetical protein
MHQCQVRFAAQGALASPCTFLFELERRRKRMGRADFQRPLDVATCDPMSKVFPSPNPAHDGTRSGPGDGA